MKKSIILSIAAGLLAIAACTPKEEVIKGGLDASKPAVSAFSYDEAASGPTTAAFNWNADQALSAGATSFTVELSKDVSRPDPVNASVYKVVYAPDVAYAFKNLKKDDFWYARIRANYPGLYYSEWTYLGSASAPLAVQVGAGPVQASFSAPANLTATVTDQSIKASWNAVPFADSYTFEYKPASSGDWSVVSDLKVTTYEVEGLVPQTAYDIRVKALQGENASDYTSASVTTTEPSKFNPAMSDVASFLEFMKAEAASASSSAEFSLEADIDLSGQSIGSVETFKGVLDGKGHSIKGLKSGTPLFGTLTGTVKNIVFDASCEFAPEVAFFGIVAGINQGTISGVTNKAAVNFSADAVAEPMLIAAIAGQSSGEISGCVNEGAITASISGATVAVGTAGIVGYQSAAIKNCENKGDITFTAKNISAKVAVIDATGALPSTGGIAAFGAPGFSIDGCNNRGKITHSITAADTDLTANLNRNQIGGIAGSPCGAISNSNNYGEINVSVKNSTPGTALNYEFIVCVGGIGGGDYQFTNSTDGPFSNTSYINCINEGNIVVDSDASKSNSTLGGIVGWPGQEKPVTGTSVNGCVNRGNLTSKGVVKVRIGGVEGGTGIIENSSNEGIITFESGDATSAIGSLCGFHSQGHAITGSTAGGEVIAKVKCTGGLGGLIGNIGNAAHSNVSGNKVTCKVTAAEYDKANNGLIIGKFNGKTQAIVIGDPSPIEVSGTFNGDKASADNLWGNGNYDASMHTINYVIK
ncbi:MAG: fibronectin type III domain-containing protein [Bacteroidales bacterium]|nr:fibronectin type III domain-containing protein [Bacteroidales bacterium]